MAHIVDETAKFLKQKLSIKENPIAIILGSGFSDFLNFFDTKKEVKFSEIPNFHVVSKDENNKIIYGKIKEQHVLLVLGRLHYNYGYEANDIANLIFILKEIGCRSLIIGASVGSINSKMKVGDIVSAYDHINLTGRNPLFKSNYEKYGKLFVDMVEPYSLHMLDTLSTVAKRMRIKVKKGVFAEFNGPSIETVSESKFAKIIGADFVGFNVCCEVIASNYCKLPVCLFGLVTNFGTSYSASKIEHEDIVYNRKCASGYYLKLLESFVLSL